MASLHLAQEIFDLMYPVNSIYLSWDSSNPSSKFGGTWTQLYGGFLYGCGAATASQGNGTGTATNDHTLTIDQIPSHNHSIQMPFYKFSELNRGLHGNVYKGDLWQDAWHATASTGGGKGHSHNIPYIAIFIWRRTS